MKMISLKKDHVLYFGALPKENPNNQTVVYAGVVSKDVPEDVLSKLLRKVIIPAELIVLLDNEGYLNSSPGEQAHQVSTSSRLKHSHESIIGFDVVSRVPPKWKNVKAGTIYQDTETGQVHMSYGPGIYPKPCVRFFRFGTTTVHDWNTHSEPLPQPETPENKELA